MPGSFVDLHEVLAELSRRHAGGNNIAVAVDGSQMSDRAAQVAGESVYVTCSKATSATNAECHSCSAFCRKQAWRHADCIACQR